MFDRNIKTLCRTYILIYYINDGIEKRRKRRLSGCDVAYRFGRNLKALLRGIDGYAVSMF